MKINAEEGELQLVAADDIIHVRLKNKGGDTVKQTQRQSDDETDDDPGDVGFYKGVHPFEYPRIFK